MNLNIYNCFCLDANSAGNPAAVVFDFNGDDKDKQGIATHLNLPVTVFITNTATPSLRFFYPEKEMPLCLHGALAAGYFLMEKNNQTHCTVQTANAQLQLTKQNNRVQITVSEQQIKSCDIDKTEIQQMLKIHNGTDILSYTVKSVGSPKLLVQMASSKILNNLHPDFDLIKQWSKDRDINGLYVYAKQDNHFIARGFNPKGGHNEDAATGVAAAALTLALQQSITVFQGETLHQPCKLEVVYQDSEHILVGGIIHPTTASTS